MCVCVCVCARAFARGCQAIFLANDGEEKSALINRASLTIYAPPIPSLFFLFFSFLFFSFFSSPPFYIDETLFGLSDALRLIENSVMFA